MKPSYIDEISEKWYLWQSKQSCFKFSCGEKTDKSIDKNTEKSQNTQSKILMAAFDEIFKTGFQAASLNKILKDTGITKGALYHHYANKKELGYAVVDEVIRGTIYLHWIEPLNETNDPITTLQTIIRNLGALMTEESVKLGCPLNNLAQEMSPIDEGFRVRIATIYKEWQDAIEASLEKGKQEGTVIESIDSHGLSVLFVATLEGCLGYAKSVQCLDSLMICGNSMIDRLESIRPIN